MKSTGHQPALVQGVGVLISTTSVKTATRQAASLFEERLSDVPEWQRKCCQNEDQKLDSIQRKPIANSSDNNYGSTTKG